MTTLIYILKNKVRNFFCLGSQRDPGVSSRQPEINVQDAPDRAHTAAQLDAVDMDPFPDFDPAADWSWVEDILEHCTPNFWGGERPHRWDSGFVTIGPNREKANGYEQITSLMADLNMQQRDHMDESLSFWPYPLYQYGDPPTCEFFARQLVVHAGQSICTDELDDALDKVIRELAGDYAWSHAEKAKQEFENYPSLRVLRSDSFGTRHSYT
ncbi:hypothetical protein BKA67DRAFT_537854 [Truncatella angustata]|uniref:Uncharacterized protein n=1 Tax=Truncatella angustata TaxID=152316 RepID=A0A9P8ZWI9_9PEZI|nr:uncharacterized protein BKA67DRAFT_537854 [Truncatella angustata]KAH6652008.1 hypothetical protein BKA67DRAFT_537854 [Truncatella angustata]KAH8195204.1 hypothetical protein TruAng_010622 [Truncatella angustata]